MTNYNLFLQKAMLPLLDKLDLESTFSESFDFLAEQLDIEAIAFNLTNLEDLHITTKFIVNKDGFFNEDLHFDLNKKDCKIFNEHKTHDNIINFSNLEHLSIGDNFLSLLNNYISYAKRSILVLLLRNEENTVGNLCFISKANHNFNTSHEEKIRILRSYFAIPISKKYKVQSFNKEKIPANDVDFLTICPLIGSKSGLKNVTNAINQLKNTDVPVLIQGETGTGKELVANAIQMNSLRKHNRFIKVNCGAFTTELLVSELFGHEKGAFTGASKLYKGKFEQANGGTLFLDEVGELSLSAQVLLLRVLQDGMLYRVGGNKAIKVDVRIITATNRNLSEMRSKKLFREDLFHRLSVFPIQLPALRQRTEDIPLLMRHFTKKICKILKISEPPISEQSMEKLTKYSWPGNVRELENLVERALIFNNKEALDISKYLPQLGQQKEASPQIQDLQYNIDPKILAVIDNRIAKALNMLSVAAPMPKTHNLKDTVTTEIEDALKKCNGKIYGQNGAAQLLGMKEHKLRYLLQKNAKYKEHKEHDARPNSKLS